MVSLLQMDIKDLFSRKNKDKSNKSKDYKKVLYNMIQLCKNKITKKYVNKNSIPYDVGSEFGLAISLSSDGTILAVGAWGFDITGTDEGAVFVYQYNG